MPETNPGTISYVSYVYCLPKEINYLCEDIFFYFFTLYLISGVAKKSRGEQAVIHEKSLRSPALEQ